MNDPGEVELDQDHSPPDLLSPYDNYHTQYNSGKHHIHPAASRSGFSLPAHSILSYPLSLLRLQYLRRYPPHERAIRTGPTH